MSRQARAFTFTWNYPYCSVDEMDFRSETRHAVALVWQEELGHETGTPHMQGYIKFNDRIRVSQVKDFFIAVTDKLDTSLQEFAGVDGLQVHLQVANGSPAQNYAYCTKEDTRNGTQYEFGNFGVAQGKRSDLLALRDALVQQRPMEEIVTDDVLAPIAARHIPYVKFTMDIVNKPPQRPNTYVILCLGLPGAGKTYCATHPRAGEEDHEAYYKDGASEFWEGYSGQKKVILDEFSERSLGPLVLQRVCDIYPMTVNKKGSSYPLMAEDFRITSNFEIQYWFTSKTAYAPHALYRRIHEVHYHARPGEVVKYTHHHEGTHVITAYERFLAGNHYLPPPRIGARI